MAAPTVPKYTTVGMGQGRGEVVRDTEDAAMLLEDDGDTPVVPWSAEWLNDDIDPFAVAGAPQLSSLPC